MGDEKGYLYLLDFHEMEAQDLNRFKHLQSQ